jgi:hypothetical protein
MYGHLDTDKDSHSKGDPYHGKKGSSLMVTKMAKGDAFEEVNQDHKKIPACAEASAGRQKTNECQSAKFLPAAGKCQRPNVK